MDEDIRTRMRSQQTNFQKDVHQSMRPVSSAAQEPTAVRPNSTSRKKPWFKKIKFFLAVLIILAVAAGGWRLLKNQAHDSVGGNNPVPSSITRSVNFPIYYPDSSKLPSGYYLKADSFTNNSSAVLYAINYNGGKIIVSIQPKPSDLQVNAFVSREIPLHTTYQTPIGTAAIGLANTSTTGTADYKTIVSLPANSNDTWILITAPEKIDQAQLKQVLKSLTQA